MLWKWLYIWSMWNNTEKIVSSELHWSALWHLNSRGSVSWGVRMLPWVELERWERAKVWRRTHNFNKPTWQDIIYFCPKKTLKKTWSVSFYWIVSIDQSMCKGYSTYVCMCHPSVKKSACVDYNRNWWVHIQCRGHANLLCIVSNWPNARRRRVRLHLSI